MSAPTPTTLAGEVLAPATWPELRNSIQAARDGGHLPGYVSAVPSSGRLLLAEIECATAADGLAWAQWVDADPVPVQGPRAALWLGVRRGWVVVVIAPAVSA